MAAAATADRVWLCLAAGKAADDVVWYALEAPARWGVTRCASRPGDRAVSPPDPMPQSAGH
jgi:hypothetical protein